MFTIIICTYNGARTIEKTIEHILNQKDYDKYIEQVVIVDNASIDETKKIILKYTQTDRISYSYEKNPGLGNARLNGVKLAQAEWTIFVDDDNELDPDWVCKAANYIKSNPEVGIFGGTVIPKLEFQATATEIERLKKHMGMLACTDFSREQIDLSKRQSPFGGIIGAGMVVRTEYLKELASHGWIKQMGRTGNNTAAGDDSEISIFVTGTKGKKAGYCPEMILEHNLPQSRLEEAYLLKLNRSLSIGCYKGQSLKKWYVLRRIKQVLLYMIQKNPYQEGTLESEMWKDGKEIYFDLLKKDKFIKKKI